VREDREVRMRAVHCLFPGVGSPNALLKGSDAAFDFSGYRRVTKSHSRCHVISRGQLPPNPLLISGKALERRDDDVPLPVEANERHLLLREPGQNIKGYRPAAVEHDDARQQVRIGFEEASCLCG